MIWKNAINNIIFIISGIAFLAYIFQPASMWVGVFLLVLGVILGMALTIPNIFFAIKHYSNISIILGLLISLAFTFVCRLHFLTVWGDKEVAALSILLSFLSLPFLIAFFCYAVHDLKTMILSSARYTEKRDIIKNIFNNWWFTLSVWAYLALNIQWNKIGYISFCIAVGLVPIITSQFKSMLSIADRIPCGVLGYSVISAIGISHYGTVVFREKIDNNEIAYLLAIASFISIFIISSFILNRVYDILKTITIGISGWEVLVYLVIVILLSLLAIYAFNGSTAFWGGDIRYDLTYSSDTPDIVKRNAFLRLTHTENDIRSPLFIAFSAPFIGAGYTLSIPFGGMKSVIAPILMDIVQIIMLICANYTLAKVIDLSPIGRVSFISVFTATYTGLLFPIMMEQYIIAYFWMMIAVWLCVNKERVPIFAIVAAGGTMVTSLIVLPFSEGRFRVNAFSCLIEKGKRTVAIFLLLILAMGRADIFLNFVKKTNQFSTFTGTNGWFFKIKTYFYSITNFFISPESGEKLNLQEYISWQQTFGDMNSFVFAGIIIFLVSAVIIWGNRDKRIAPILVLWISFGFVMLGIFGWGGNEGTVLYSLYLGWPFITAVFMMLKSIGEDYNNAFVIPVISLLLILILLKMNIVGISHMLEFEFSHYPY